MHNALQKDAPLTCAFSDEGLPLTTYPQFIHRFVHRKTRLSTHLPTALSPSPRSISRVQEGLAPKLRLQVQELSVANGRLYA